VSDNKSILIVEDEDDFRTALAAFLEGAGYQVVEAEHGEAALRSLRSATEFCLILLDLFMPIMNGWRFRAAQQEDPKLAGIPVLVVTAARDATRHAADLGAVAAIPKPVDFNILLEQVGRYC
jgi:CheY-like chemotaxis protein